MHAELEKVIHALEVFYARETHILEKDLGERTLTHRLAVHLEAAIRRLADRLRL